MRCFHRLLLVSSLVTASLAATAGTVTVSFVDPDRYWDAGNMSADEGPNLRALAGHLQRLGQTQLRADQTLAIEVLQIALAGTRARAAGASFRTLVGGADWPRIEVRYTLQTPGQPALSGREWVVDMDYLRGLSGARASETLYYEKRMLSGWFKARFADRQPAPG